MANVKNILIYGYGNPARQDDGLGQALIEIAEQWLKTTRMEQVTLDSNYQLQVEDVANIHDKELVVFVDASMEQIGDYHMEPVVPDPQASFTMHSVSPGYILALCQKVYGEHPQAYLLHIRGYEWDLTESLTPAARLNLEKAWEALKEIICNPDLLSETECRNTPSTATANRP